MKSFQSVGTDSSHQQRLQKVREGCNPSADSCAKALKNSTGTSPSLPDFALHDLPHVFQLLVSRNAHTHARTQIHSHSHAHQLDLIEKLAKGEGTMTSTDVGDFLELAQHVVLQHEGMDTDFPIYLSQVATIPRAISHIPR